MSATFDPFQLQDMNALFVFSCQDWVIGALAAFLGCGSRFLGFLSRIEPPILCVPVTAMVGQYHTSES